LQALNTAWHAASEELYKAQQQTNGSDAQSNTSTNGHSKKDGEVTDVDYEEVKDDKKK
jgi:molecular chaperone DnaK